jgi:hypothetical protein
MEDPSSWQELGAQFRELQPMEEEGLRVEWDSLSGKWKFPHPPTGTLYYDLRPFPGESPLMTKVQCEGTWFPQCTGGRVSNQQAQVHKAKNGIVSGSSFNEPIGPLLTTARPVL